MEVVAARVRQPLVGRVADQVVAEPEARRALPGHELVEPVPQPEVAGVPGVRRPPWPRRAGPGPPACRGPRPGGAAGARAARGGRSGSRERLQALRQRVHGAGRRRDLRQLPGEQRVAGGPRDDPGEVGVRERAVDGDHREAGDGLGRERPRARSGRAATSTPATGPGAAPRAAAGRAPAAMRRARRSAPGSPRRPSGGPRAGRRTRRAAPRPAAARPPRGAGPGGTPGRGCRPRAWPAPSAPNGIASSGSHGCRVGQHVADPRREPPARLVRRRVGRDPGELAEGDAEHAVRRRGRGVEQRTVSGATTSGSASSSAISRDLPAPGSPVMSTSPPRARAGPPERAPAGRRAPRRAR